MRRRFLAIAQKPKGVVQPPPPPVGRGLSMVWYRDTMLRPGAVLKCAQHVKIAEAAETIEENANAYEILTAQYV